MTSNNTRIWDGRAEDDLLLVGGATFTGDIRLPDMKEAVFIRSPYAHADILSIDVSAAMAAGAIAVYTACDLPFIDRHLITRYWHPAIRGGMPPLLARDRVRYVGEAVAILVAPDRYMAEDLAALVEVEYRERPVIADTRQALGADAEALHDAWSGNIAAELENVAGDADAAMAAAPQRLEATFTFARQAPLPLETRGCVADFGLDGSLTVWSSTQVHFNVRNNIAEILDIPEEKIRVVAEHVGGGFGSKSRPYPEEVLISHLSRELGCPVRWIEDRLEHLQATTHSRGTETQLEIGFDETGRVHALRGFLTVDVGAYIYTSGIVSAMTASGQCAGPYRIDHIDMQVRCVGTNRTPLATYRGAGQPEATFPIERIMDMVAEKTGLLPLEVRLCNIVTPRHMPYRPSVPFAGPKAAFESGDFPAILSRAHEMTEGEAAVQRLSSGEWVSWGQACGIEVTGFITGESARVTLNGDGTATVSSGMTTQGQGQPTTYAKVCAEILGLDWRQVSVHLGDTDLVALGRGAFASRGAVIGANAVAGAAKSLRSEILGVAATLLQASEEDLASRDGYIFHTSNNQRVSLADIATAVATGDLGSEQTNRLSAECVFDADDSLTFGFSAHVVRLALDPDTLTVRILEYGVVHDSGRPLDPVIVNGQVTGGIVDGIGGALFSEMRFDEEAQPLCGTLADYLTIGAPEAPVIRAAHIDTPATTNPLGVRGIGEGGVLPVAPAIANAIAKISKFEKSVKPQLLNTVPINLRTVWESAGF